MPQSLRATTTVAAWRQHGPFLLVFVLLGVLLFTNLGRDYLWSDEGDTAVLAESVLKFGVPKAWDGITFSDPDRGARLTDDLVMVSHPWVQYYLAAASLAIFGPTAFAARFPFALAGLATMALVYALLLRVTGRRRAALGACVLLLLSVQFLLYSRQARNYSLTMCLACALLLVFLHLTTRRAAVVFTLLAVAGFHAGPTVLVPVGVMGVLTLVHEPCRRYRRWFWRSAPIILVLTAPWLIWATAGYGANTHVLNRLSALGPRLVQFLIESTSMTPLIGLGALLLLARIWLHRRRTSPPRASAHPAHRRAATTMPNDAPATFLSPDEWTFLFFTLGSVVAYGFVLALTQSVDDMYLLGLRYAAPLLPFTIGVVAMMAARVSGRSRPAWLTIMVVLAVTPLGRLTPWATLGDDTPDLILNRPPTVHVPIGWMQAVLKGSLVSFVHEVWHSDPGTVGQITAFLRAHASPGDIVITNYGWEPIYFYTGLPQGLKIWSEFPIYGAAKADGLPEYVFSVAGARWLIWRWAWEGYARYRWDVVSGMLARQGATLTKVATVPETIWENRENVFFHRFDGDGYAYAQLPDARDAEIYRVDWPATTDLAEARRSGPGLPQ